MEWLDKWQYDILRLVLMGGCIAWLVATLSIAATRFFYRFIYRMIHRSDEED